MKSAVAVYAPGEIVAYFREVQIIIGHDFLYFQYGSPCWILDELEDHSGNNPAFGIPGNDYGIICYSKKQNLVSVQDELELYGVVV